MIGPFKVFEEEVFPKVHSYVVHKLVNEGIKQQIIAEKLGITQAMVSKYLLKEEEEDNLIEKIGMKSIELIRNNSTNEEMTCMIIDYCLKLMLNGEICDICSKKNNLKSCNACMNLGVSEERGKVISSLKKAIDILERENPVNLMPNVMMNIAMSIENAKNKEEVASIPGRIVKINNKIKASNSPEFNSSNHLANKLLENKKFKAIMNIKYDQEIEKSIKKTKLKDIIIDKGGFGIEPCVYILGNDAIDVANKLIKINGEYEK